MRCQVPDCCGKVVSKGLCDKHRIRLRDHGHLDSTRPTDWGSRSGHPLYDSWRWIRKRTGNGVTPRWDEFWSFVEDVEERPSKKHTLRRFDELKPWGPDNWFWKERTASSKDAKAYARAYRKKNPLAAKSSELKKQYGITIDDYMEMLKAQSGGCAICGTKENEKYKYFSIDHCHETGNIRGLLCTKCNQGLGCFRDSLDLINAAKRYLHRAIWNERPI